MTRSSSGKHTGVSIYHGRNLFHLRVLGIQHMHECINVEMKIGCKPCIIIDLLWSPRKLQDELRNEKSGMKMTCTFFERNITENATLKFDLQEVIKDATHIWDNSHHALILSLHLRQTC